MKWYKSENKMYKIFTNLYRKYMPIGIRYKIGNVITSKYDRINYEKVLSGEWRDKYPDETEYIIRHGKITTFPYEWTKKYDEDDIKVSYDESGMPYVSADGKRMYFPKRYPPFYIKKYFNTLRIEQDPDSAHYYFAPESEWLKGCTFVDVGGAEGFISLRVIDYAERVIIYEPDPDWIKALNMTFEPYKDKVRIINRYASDFNDKKTTTLDAGTAGYGRIVLKMDVEGMEMSVLHGAEAILDKDDTRIFVCTYHKPEDEELIGRYLSDKGYHIEKSEGVMFYGTDDGSFRRGIIRAGK